MLSLCRSERGFSLAQDTVPEGGIEALSRDDIDPASEPILQKILHGDQIDQIEPGVRGNIDEYVDVTIGASCPADD